MTKEFYNTVYQEDHASQYDGGPSRMEPRVVFIRGKTANWLSRSEISSNHDLKILEVGCGMAYLSDIHPGWHGLEYSKTAVKRVLERLGKDANVFEGDAQSLPFKNAYFDAVYSWAVLEHVADPNLAFEEIDRVLKPGGLALIAPAWNCRPWTVKKLKERSYSELSFLEYIEKFFIPLREWIVYRAIVAMPLRLWAELTSVFGGIRRLRYRKLFPRWDLIEKLGHVSDDDAVAHIEHLTHYPPWRNWEYYIFLNISFRKH